LPLGSVRVVSLITSAYTYRERVVTPTDPKGKEGEILLSRKKRNTWKTSLRWDEYKLTMTLCQRANEPMILGLHVKGGNQCK
jgi:hypothetical protein